jgi:hypothetical protein
LALACASASLSSFTLARKRFPTVTHTTRHKAHTPQATKHIQTNKERKHRHDKTQQRRSQSPMPINLQQPPCRPLRVRAEVALHRYAWSSTGVRTLVDAEVDDGEGQEPEHAGAGPGHEGLDPALRLVHVRHHLAEPTVARLDRGKQGGA